MRCVVYRGVGGAEVVSLEERPDPEPGRFEVLLAPAFAGLNPADVLQREGKHPPPPGAPDDVPGLEVAGEVIACGDGVSTFSVGDRALGLVGGGGLATRVVAHERELARVPQRLDDRSAAAVPEAFITAFDALCRQAELGAGDRLLINGANGGVGTAAVQIGAAMGAEVIAGVRTADLRPRVAELGAAALGPEDAFEHVRSAGGADVILELVGAVHMSQNLAALAGGGRIIVVAAAPGDETTIALRHLMAKRGRIFGTTLRRRPLEQKADLVQDFARRVLPQLGNGRLRAVVDRVFALDDVGEALERIRQRGKFGKLLLELDEAAHG